MPLYPHSRHWEGLATDVITDLPEATAWGYTGILVIVERLTKMQFYLSCTNDIDSPELVRMVLEHVILKLCLPDNIAIDCDKVFTSRLWDRVCLHLSINHRLSTAVHPQTDSEPKQQNRQMEQFLRAFCIYEQDNWVTLLLLAEFAYNNSIHLPTLMTAFWANYNYYPRMQLSFPRTPVSEHSCRQFGEW
jgi:hypothetical protein